MCGIPFLPRSPRWLAKQDRREEAIATLANIQAHGDKEDPMVLAEWEEIITVLQAEREAAPGWKKFVLNSKLGLATDHFPSSALVYRAIR